MDRHFEQAVINIQKYIDNCGRKILINECKFDEYWTSRYKEPWYTFKVAEENSQDIEYEVSLPAIEDFHDETIIYLNSSKWYVKNALITKDTIIGTLEGNIEKCNEDKEYYEDLINKYKIGD
jgi:hypothetical protein